MPENQTAASQPPVAAEEEISLLDILIVLAKHKLMILGLTIAAAIIAAIYAWSLPNIYTASAQIMPPQGQASSANAILSQLGGMGGAAGNILGLKNPADVYVAMLKSRRLRGNMVQRLALQKTYGHKGEMETINMLGKMSAFAVGKDGLITVEVSDTDPQRAAMLANGYTDELNNLMQTMAVTDASMRRMFLERQLKPAKDKLTDAGIALDRTPNTSLHYMDVLRNLKYQEGLYEILAKQYEMAKLDEAKDAPLIQVLDKAVVPAQKTKPKRSLIVVVAALAAGLLGMLFAFVFEASNRAKANPEQAERVRVLIRYFWKK